MLAKRGEESTLAGALESIQSRTRTLQSRGARRERACYRAEGRAENSIKAGKRSSWSPLRRWPTGLATVTSCESNWRGVEEAESEASLGGFKSTGVETEREGVVAKTRVQVKGSFVFNRRSEPL